MQRRVSIVCVLCALALAAALCCERPSAPDSEACGCITYWLHPSGNDTNAGSYGSKWKTLQRANDYLLATNPNANVTIRLISDEGTYENMFTEWTWHRTGRSITIESWPDTVNAVCHMSPDSARSAAWFVLDAKLGEASNVTFRRLTIRGYNRDAIDIGGGSDNDAEWNGYNVIEHCTFDSIGNLVGGTMAYGVLDFVNSRHNIIRNCRFSDCQNDTVTQQILGIYFAHSSSYNQVYEDTFWNVYGDGVRMRDESNYNEVHNCWFEKVGANAAVTMWYNYFTTECPSRGNLVYDNWITGNKQCIGVGIAAYDMVSALREGCEDVQPRITAYDNIVDTCLYHPCPVDTGGIE
jgi:hypothetical protein